ncbi:MAG: mandelate racemase/muconate lactonizing enzyme family protein [Chromatiales bacterium]
MTISISGNTSRRVSTDVKIASLSLEPLRIPFRVSFKHASAERNVTQSVLVIARSDDGLRGYGEGCPRDYVTGETDASVVAFFERHRVDLIAKAIDLPTLEEWRQGHERDIDENPAAWCAIELALLDLFARQNKQPVEALLGMPLLAGPFGYTAVLGAIRAAQFDDTLGRYQKLGLRDYKIKLSGDSGRDRANLAILKSAGIAPEQVRADANNLWSDRKVAQYYLESLDYPFAAIEEPLRPGRFADLVVLAESLATRIVLDESITRENQLSQLPGAPARWIVNLRVSKMGGLLRSLSVTNRCREMGLALVVGAQVGETSLLTRAALIVAQAAGDIVIGQEGAFGTMLLESDAVQPTLMFGANGELDIDSLQLDQSPGFGLVPAPDLAKRYFKHKAGEGVRRDWRACAACAKHANERR